MKLGYPPPSPKHQPGPMKDIEPTVYAPSGVPVVMPMKDIALALAMLTAGPPMKDIALATGYAPNGAQCIAVLCTLAALAVTVGYSNFATKP